MASNIHFLISKNPQNRFPLVRAYSEKRQGRFSMPFLKNVICTYDKQTKSNNTGCCTGKMPTPIATAQRTWSALTGHPAIPRGVTQGYALVMLHEGSFLQLRTRVVWVFFLHWLFCRVLSSVLWSFYCVLKKIFSKITFVFFSYSKVSIFDSTPCCLVRTLGLFTSWKWSVSTFRLSSVSTLSVKTHQRGEK